MSSNHDVVVQTMRGVSAQIARRFLLVPINLLAGIILARTLRPEDFGVYAAALLVVSTLVTMTDAGMGAAIVQKPQDPEISDLRTVFAAQLGLGILGVMAAIMVAPLITAAYGLSSQALWFLRVVAIVIAIDGLGTVSRALLNRRLAYTRLAMVDTLANVVFQVMAVSAALADLGLWSFAVAWLTSTITKVAVLFASAPWPVGLTLERRRLASVVQFGGFYQAGALTALPRDNIPAILAGPLFGAAAVGFLRWAMQTAFLVGQEIAHIVEVVSFPSFARLQHDRRGALAMAVSSLRYVLVVTLPLLALLIALAPNIVHIIYTDHWAPAIPMLYLYAIAMVGNAIVALSVAVLNGLGEVRTTFYLLVSWMALDWILAIPFALWWGAIGIAGAYAAGVLPVTIWLIWRIYRMKPILLWHTILAPGVAAVVTGAVVAWLGQPWATSLVRLIMSIGGGLALYGFFLMAVDGPTVRRDVQAGWASLRRVLAARGEVM